MKALRLFVKVSGMNLLILVFSFSLFPWLTGPFNRVRLPKSPQGINPIQKDESQFRAPCEKKNCLQVWCFFFPLIFLFNDNNLIQIICQFSTRFNVKARPSPKQNWAKKFPGNISVSDKPSAIISRRLEVLWGILSRRSFQNCSWSKVCNKHKRIKKQQTAFINDLMISLYESLYC